MEVGRPFIAVWLSPDVFSCLFSLEAWGQGRFGVHERFGGSAQGSGANMI